MAGSYPLSPNSKKNVMLMRLIMAESESNPGRKRKSETAEKLVDCVDENCSNKQKTYRVIAKQILIQ